MQEEIIRKEINSWAYTLFPSFLPEFSQKKYTARHTSLDFIMNFHQRNIQLGIPAFFQPSSWIFANKIYNYRHTSFFWTFFAKKIYSYRLTSFFPAFFLNFHKRNIQLGIPEFSRSFREPEQCSTRHTSLFRALFVNFLNRNIFK